MKWYQTLGCLASLTSVIANCSPRYFVIPSDVNRDRYVDLVVGEQSGNVYVLLNSKKQKEDTQRDEVNSYLKNKVVNLPVKTEGYTRKTIGMLREGVKQLGVFDINNDGLEDVIAVDNRDGVFLFYNNGDGSFRMDKTTIVK